MMSDRLVPDDPAPEDEGTCWDGFVNALLFELLLGMLFGAVFALWILGAEVGLR